MTPDNSNDTDTRQTAALILRNDGVDGAQLEVEGRSKAVFQKFVEWVADLERRGVYAGVEGLQQSGKTVRRKGAGLVIDGPFAEGREAVLGFILVRVHNMDEACAIAGESPHADLRVTGMSAVALEEQHLERAQDAIEAHGELVGRDVELELDVLFPEHLTRAHHALLYGGFVESQRATQGRHWETAERPQRKRERALERNRRMTADEHHLQQIFVAIRHGDGRLELIERFARCDPRRAANGINHAPPRGDLQPRAGALGDVRTPALDRGDESLLDSGLDQIEATRAKRACERSRDRGRVLPVQRIEIDHEQSVARDGKCARVV
jgi:hypothetical protein